MLPAALVAGVDWSGLVLETSALPDEELSHRETDLLFQVPWAQDGPSGQAAPARLAIIFEHQSTVDPRMALRVLRYTLRFWDRWLRENPGAQRVPLVVPLVMYHGHARWTAPLNVRDMVGPAGLYGSLKGLRPGFSYQLHDLSHVPQRDLQGTLQGIFCQVLLQGYRAEDLVALLEQALRDFGAFPPPGLPVSFIEYIWAVDPALRRVEDHATVITRLRERIGEQQMGIRELILEEGFQKGRQEGQQEGQTHGRHTERADTVVRLLERRFNSLTRVQRDQIAGADPEALQRIVDAIFDLEDLEQALGML